MSLQKHRASLQGALFSICLSCRSKNVSCNIALSAVSFGCISCNWHRLNTDKQGSSTGAHALRALPMQGSCLQDAALPARETPTPSGSQQTAQAFPCTLSPSACCTRANSNHMPAVSVMGQRQWCTQNLCKLPVYFRADFGFAASKFVTWKQEKSSILTFVIFAPQLKHHINCWPA